MKVFFRFPQYNLDSTPRSRKIDKILAKFFPSFISPQIIAAAPIGFLFLKAFYFQMYTVSKPKLSNAH